MEKKAEMGVCQYCGQYVEVSWLRDLNPERYEYAEADYLASRICTCREAQEFSAREEAREQAEERRKLTLATADSIIDELFGSGAQGAGEVVMHEDSRRLVREAAELVYDGYLRTVSISDARGITAKLKMTSKNRLSISRHESSSISQEA